MAYLVSQNDCQDITTRRAMTTLIHLNILSLFMIILPFNLTAATKVQLSDGTVGCSVQSVVKGKGKGKSIVHPRIDRPRRPRRGAEV